MHFFHYGDLTFITDDPIGSKIYKILDKQDNELGDVVRQKDGKWFLSIPSLGIEDEDQYRNDLFERCEIFYKKRTKK